MFGASVSEVYKIIRCQFDLKIDNLIGNKKETNGCKTSNSDGTLGRLFANDTTS